VIKDYYRNLLLTLNGMHVQETALKYTSCATEFYLWVNWRDVQRQNGVNKVDRSFLKTMNKMIGE